MPARAFVCFLLIALAAAAMPPRSAHAQSQDQPDRWEIGPLPDADPARTAKGYYVYSMQPGEQAGGRVLLRNPGASAVTIDLSAVNAQTAQQGGSAFADADAMGSGVAGWIELSRQQVTLAPGAEQAVSFTVRAPDTVQPGQYLAGIAASEAPVAGVPGSAAVKPSFGARVTVRTRYVIAVQADIVGTWKPALSIPNVSVLDQPSGMVIGVQVRNDGGVFVTPAGSIMVTDAAGTQLLAQAIEMGTFVPGTEVIYPIRWPGQPTAGTYRATVTLAYADGKTATYDGNFAIAGDVAQRAAERAAAGAAPQNVQPLPAASPSVFQPWMVYLLGALLLLLIVMLGLNLRRGRPRAVERNER